MARIAMAYLVVAHTTLGACRGHVPSDVCIGIGCACVSIVITDYIVMALQRYGLYRHGFYSYGLYSSGLYSRSS